MSILQEGPVRRAAAYLCVIGLSLFALELTGVPMEEGAAGRALIIWAVLSLCHAVHWHAWVTAPVSHRPADPT